MTTRYPAFVLAVMLVFLAATVAAQTAAPTGTQVPDASQFVGPPRGVAIQGQQLERRTTEIGALLRCPVCQGLAVSDSRAEMAVNMKGQIRELLARGYTEEQILSYFEQSYGQFVLLKPKFQGFNTLVWLLPVIALVIGLAIVVVKARSLGRGPVQPPATPEETVTGEAEDPYLAQVRDLVGGAKR